MITYTLLSDFDLLTCEKSAELGKSRGTDGSKDLLLCILHYKRKLWLRPCIPFPLAALYALRVDEGPITGARLFILDLHAARGPAYCSLRPYYQHLLF